MDDTPFAITSNDAVFKEYKVSKDGIVLLKKYDEGRNNYEGKMAADEITTWVGVNSLALVSEFTQEVSAAMWSRPSCVVLGGKVRARLALGIYSPIHILYESSGGRVVIHHILS